MVPNGNYGSYRERPVTSEFPQFRLSIHDKRSQPNTVHPSTKHRKPDMNKYPRGKYYQPIQHQNSNIIHSDKNAPLIRSLSHLVCRIGGSLVPFQSPKPTTDYYVINCGKFIILPQKDTPPPVGQNLPETARSPVDPRTGVGRRCTDK